MKNHQTKEITYAQAAKVADTRTMSALVAIGSPPLELDEKGRVAVLGGMSEKMVHDYGVAYLGQANGNLWANLGYPTESEDSGLVEQPETPRTIFSDLEFLASSARKSTNLALFQLIVVIAVSLALWFSGFNVLITGWIGAYIETWVISPIAGIVFSVIIYGLYRLLEALKKIF